MYTVIAIVVIVLSLLIYLIYIYNKLITFKNRYLNSFSQIEIQLKRRYDLIPNLVEVAKGYIKHERETLEAVINARNAAANVLTGAKENLLDNASIGALNQAEKNLTGVLGRFNVVVEAYPDLKASETMIKLHEDITSTENKVAFARQAYNDSVMNYNTFRQSFPQKLFAASFGHTNDAVLLVFEDNAAIKSAPKISFT